MQVYTTKLVHMWYIFNSKSDINIHRYKDNVQMKTYTAVYNQSKSLSYIYIYNSDLFQKQGRRRRIVVKDTPSIVAVLACLSGLRWIKTLKLKKQLAYMHTTQDLHVRTVKYARTTLYLRTYM